MKTVDRFMSVSRSLRLHSGDDALSQLPREMQRLGVSRAVVVCGQSVAHRTNLIQRISDLLGDQLVAVFDGLRKDAPLSDVQDCAMLVREKQADLLIAVGAGSVLKGTRVVAILAAEQTSAWSLVTQFPPNAPPISPRLNAPKLPIFNVVTAATSAQNRAGSALRNPDDDKPRLEFFDPKTRPVALFWDSKALLTAPESMAVNTAVSILWRALMNIGAIDRANPLVQASRHQALNLALKNLPRMRDTTDARARIDLCAAALLQNRDEDDGGKPFDAHLIAKSVYGLGAALFNRINQLEQGVTHVLLTSAAILQFQDDCKLEITQIGLHLGLSSQQASDAQEVSYRFRALFAPYVTAKGLQELGVNPTDLEPVLINALSNFNANRDGLLTRHQDQLMAILCDSL